MLDAQKSINYLLTRLDFINLDKIGTYFEHLPVDPYLKENYRFRRLSHFKISSNGLIKLPHSRLFQSKEYNPLLGNVVREYPEIDDALVELEDFQKIIWEFFEFCKLYSTSDQIGVHQIRTTSSSQTIGNPAPEGIHRDGVDLIGIFCVSRECIEGGETHLYKLKNEPPVFNQILNKSDLLVFDDRQFFHYTSPIKVAASTSGNRDVFVLTCPGLIAAA
ncbi:MAG: 2OG-Fe dioxygenase family protein [Aetokthonos hydrillicola CCALA 1050]|nr:2OG-Fe dioxygenase family protein [Aetokthonos hydrillicola CCALA 1050]MBW4584678.1 2OG-Fe dioxygenase family protein [Aetokthonos hydrillicola CCALA 1050]